MQIEKEIYYASICIKLYVFLDFVTGQINLKNLEGNLGAKKVSENMEEWINKIKEKVKCEGAKSKAKLKSLAV